MNTLRWSTRRSLAGALLAAFAALGPAGALAHMKSSTDSEPPRVEAVTVVDASTILVTFNEALADDSVNLSSRHFYVEHLNADSPHTHEASGLALSADRTRVELSLARALHPDRSMPLIIDNVPDLAGNVVSDKETIKYEGG